MISTFNIEDVLSTHAGMEKNCKTNFNGFKTHTQTFLVNINHRYISKHMLQNVEINIIY